MNHSGAVKAMRHRPRERQVAAGGIHEVAVDLSVARGERRARALLLGASVALALVFGVAGVNLAGAWLVGRALDWRLASESVLALVPLVGFVLMLCVVLAHWNWAFVRSLALRSAALAGYDQVAPLAARQPARLKTRELSDRPTELMSLRRIEDARRPALVVAVSALGLVVLALGLLAVTRGVALVAVYARLAGLLAGAGATDPARRFLLGVLLALDGLALLAALGLVVRHLTSLRAATGPHYLMDDAGLRLASGGQTIPWTAARAFYMAVERGWLGGGTRAVYVLDTGALQLSWAVAAGANADVGTQHETLARFIVTRTKLPLRDLSREAGRLAGWRAIWTPPTALAADAIVRSWIHLGVAGAAEARLMRASRRLYRLAGAALLGLALLAGGGALVQRAQTQQRTALLARIRVTTPLYADPLTIKDDDWPTRQPAAQTGSFQFESDAYQLGHGPHGTFLYALGPKSYGNAAVQVTVRQTGISPNSGAGLALRAQDDPVDLVVFAVSQSGGWFLARYQGATESAAPGAWIALGGDVGSGVVHSGIGATNQLTVVMVGTTYTCYINGKFVGTVHTSAATSPRTSGAAGVWLGDASTTGAFTHFAVYPVPAT